MPSPDPVRSQHARVAALARIAKEPSGAAMLVKANQAFRDSFYEATDEELPEKERQRQADAAYRLHMSRLALRASAARKRAAAERQAAREAEAELRDLQHDNEV
jgi:hypothetical protein